MSDASQLVTSRGKPLRLSQRVAQELTEQVVRGQFEPGATLPTEGALCDMFEVSRPVVREAVKALEQRGLLRVRQGEGTTVRPRAEWNLLDPGVLAPLLGQDDEPQLKQDVIALRRNLETDMVRRAAGKLSEADFAEMDAHLRTMDSDVDSMSLYHADTGFHGVIHRASGNEIAHTIVSLLVSDVTNVLGHSESRYYTEANAQHRRIRDLLESGHAEEAAECMALHVSTQWLLWRP